MKDDRLYEHFRFVTITFIYFLFIMHYFYNERIILNSYLQKIPFNVTMMEKWLAEQKLFGIVFDTWETFLGALHESRHYFAM